MNSTEKYGTLKECIETCAKVNKENAKLFKEPKWPDHIDDLKAVIQFRNEVHDVAFEYGRLSAFSQISRYIQKLEEGLDLPTEDS